MGVVRRRDEEAKGEEKGDSVTLALFWLFHGTLPSHVKVAALVDNSKSW